MNYHWLKLYRNAVCLGVVAMSAGVWFASARQICAAGGSEIGSEKYILTEPGALQNGIREGGLSGLFHHPDDPADVVYSICDRGANKALKIDGEPRLAFADLEHGPTIYKLQLKDGQARILERIALSLPSGVVDPSHPGASVGGLPNLATKGETPYDAVRGQVLPYDPHGLDTEGIALNRQDRSFWLCDEYSPSLVHADSSGRIITRLVPMGLAAKLGIAYAVDALPAIYAKRQPNRGFEGVALTPDGRFLYGVLQSPLENPDRAAGEQSRLIRLLKIDLATGLPVGEYVYPKDDAEGMGLKQNKLVVSDLYALGEDQLIVDERDTLEGEKARSKRLYRIDLTRATNILGKMDQPGADGKTLEQHAPEALPGLGIVPVSKVLLLDLLAAGFPFEKIEGACLLDGHSLAVVNDNDFSFDVIDGKIVDTQQPTQISVYRFSTEIR